MKEKKVIDYTRTYRRIEAENMISGGQDSNKES